MFARRWKLRRRELALCWSNLPSVFLRNPRAWTAQIGGTIRIRFARGNLTAANDSMVLWQTACPFYSQSAHATAGTREKTVQRRRRLNPYFCRSGIGQSGFQRSANFPLQSPGSGRMLKGIIQESIP